MVLRIISGGGVTLINGVSHKIKKGKVLINGTSRTIEFEQDNRPKVTVKFQLDSEYTHPDAIDIMCDGTWIATLSGFMDDVDYIEKQVPVGGIITAYFNDYGRKNPRYYKAATTVSSFSNIVESDTQLTCTVVSAGTLAFVE